MSDISVSVTQQTVSAAVSGDTVSASVNDGTVSTTVTGGLGPQGPIGPQGPSGEGTVGPTGVTPGSYGSGSAVATFTVQSDGRLTAAGTSSIAIGPTQVSSGLGLANLQADLSSLSSITSSLGTAAQRDVPDAGTDASSAKVVLGSDTRLTNSREWSADTVSQAEAEAGTATTRRAWTAQRVFQAIAAWWSASSAKTKLDGIATGATANQTDAYLLSRTNHTGTQAASTIGSGTLDIARIPTGTTSTTVCVGNDARLSDARTPSAHKTSHSTGGSDALSASDIGAAASSHTHAGSDITSGTVASARLGSGTADATTFLRGDGTWAVPSGGGGSYTLPAATTTTLGGVIVSTGLSVTAGGTLTVSYGTSSTTACVGNDARLSDARTPTAHVHSGSDITSGTIDNAYLPSAISVTSVTASAFLATTSGISNTQHYEIVRSAVTYFYVSNAGVVTTGTWQGTAVGIAYGGTGATTQSGARTALGLAIGTDVAAASHTHAAGDITSGTLAAARLPLATVSAAGAIIVGSGLAVSSGTVSTDPRYNSTTTVTLTGTANALDIGTASRVFLDPGGSARTVNGILSAADGTEVLLINSGSSTITLTHQSGSAQSDRRIQTPTGSNYSLGANGSARIVYDDGLGCWRLVGVSESDSRLVGDGSKGDISVAGSVWTIANSVVTVAKLSATGTANNTTFLRGDGAWATPSGGGSSVGGDLYLWSAFR